ncbi:hypothetical protein ScPMuIL_009162 [Solemya velum]
MVADVDLVNRDPNDLNDHVKAQFHEVLAEPEGVHSIDCVWRNSYTCFNFGKNCCYKLLTTLCGIFVALFWGCEFALITFEQVWCTTPELRVFSIYTGCCQKFFGLGRFVSCCYGIEHNSEGHSASNNNKNGDSPLSTRRFVRKA